MPNFTYGFLGAGGGVGGACNAGPGAPLVAIPTPVLLTWPQLINAQLRLGVYPVGWVVDELTWRTVAFVISCANIAVAGGVPVAPPAPGVVPGGAVLGGGGGVPASPVAVGVDATERGQLGYHMGTGIGGSLGEYLAPAPGAGPGTLWFPYHLSRAIANGGVFGFATPQRPDIVTYAVTPGPVNIVQNFVVWENKGHCVNFGGLAAIGPALLQAQSLVNMTSIPGNPALGVVGGTPCPAWVPDCHVASQVDLTGVGGNFRVQTIDPDGPGQPPFKLSPKQADDFFRGYYAPYVEAVQKATSADTRTYDGVAFRTLALPKQVRFGLQDEIAKAFLSTGSPGTFATAVHAALAKLKKPSAPDRFHVHATGISTEIPSPWNPSPPLPSGSGRGAGG